MKKILLLVVVLSLFGCVDKELSGTYSSSWNGRNITFSSNGTAVVTRQDGGPLALGGEPVSYKVNGNVITMGALTMKLMPDGSIDGGAAYGKMIKK